MLQPFGQGAWGSSEGTVAVPSASLATPGEEKVKDKVFYGQEPPSRESTTTICEVNYLLAVMLLNLPTVELICSGPHPAIENGVREGRSNWHVVAPTLHWAIPPELHVLHDAIAGYKSQDLLQPLGREHATFGMIGQRRAINGISYCHSEAYLIYFTFPSH